MRELGMMLRRLQRRPETWLLAVIVLVGAFLSAAAPGFLTPANLVDLLDNYSVQAIMALGLFVVLVSGGIDISFAATASVAQYSAALLATQTPLPAVLCILVGLAVGTLLGCVNAALIHFVRITSIIATIATMSVYFSLLMYVTGGKSIYDLPDWWTGRIVFFETESASGDLTRVTLPVVVMLVAALLTWALMTRSAVGRQLYALGGNPEAARRIGANVAALHFVAYGFLGFMAALAGLVQAHRVGESVPNALNGGELAVLSAAVLGGASLSGGIGTVPGVLCGIVLLAMLQNGLNLLGVSSYFFQIVIGLTILGSTSVTVLSARARRRHRTQRRRGERPMVDVAPTELQEATRKPLVGRLSGVVTGSVPGLVVLLVLLIAGFSIAVPGFASIGTMQSFMYQLPMLGLLALAMLFPLISGGLNLAIIATANQCALLMAFLMKVYAPAGTDMATVAVVVGLAMVAGFALCILIGLVTGAFVAYTGVHPILVTLGTKSLIDGISIWLTHGTVISGIPKAYAEIGNGVVFRLPLGFIVLIAAAALTGLVLRRTPFGIACAMIGSNLEATRYSAIDTKRVLIGVYLTSSILCFVAGVVMLAVFNSASAEYAQSYLLVTILAAVLGGVDPFGGFGRVSGLMLALAVLQVISSGFNQLGLSNYLTVAIWGLTLIGVMTLQTLLSSLSFLRRRG